MEDKLKFPKAHDYLDRVREADEYVTWLEERAANLRMLLTDTANHLTGMPHGGGTDPQRHETIQAEIDALERETEDAKKAARDIKLEVGMAICKLADPTEQKVLIHRFIQHKEWKDVANEIGYSISQTFKFRDNAMTELEKLLATE